MPIPVKLTQTQKFELVEKLLACPCFQSASSRQAVCQQLAAKIHISISLGATHNAKEEALAIVDTCLTFEQGLAELIRAIQFFDGDTTTPTTAFTELSNWLNLNGLARAVVTTSEPSQKSALLAATPLLLPKAVSQLPRRNPLFTGRDKELEALHAALAQSSTVALIALHGLGGIGKTSLALEYCYQHKAEYDLVTWLPSENVPSLQQEYMSLAGRLGLPDMLADTPEKQAQLIQIVREKLATSEKSWLLVFDNAEKPEDIEPLLPGGLAAKGHVIITSRSKLLASLGQSQPVKLLPEEEALALLAKHSQRQIATQQQSPKQLKQSGHDKGNNYGFGNELELARELVGLLGCLALAVTQAGAYIYTTGCSVREYLALFRKASTELFNDALAKPKDYPATVATTWELSFEKVRGENPGAADLLCMLAFFAPEGIMVRWFTTEDKQIRQVRRQLPRSISALTEDIRTFNRGLATLQKYSLVTRSGAGSGVSMGNGDYLAVHRLSLLLAQG